MRRNWSDRRDATIKGDIAVIAGSYCAGVAATTHWAIVKPLSSPIAWLAAECAILYALTPSALAIPLLIGRGILNGRDRRHAA